ncbi:MAG: DUF4236 domain-containing protein [Chloroflexi bacterium]|nr:DUF4236 domain-containing protein [Chloroflexota bacterium]
MGIRFGKRIKLGKYVSLNISKGGVSMSAGVKGARITTGRRGTYLTAGIPGSGISYQTKLGGSSAQRGSSAVAHRGGSAMPQAARATPPVKPPSPSFLAPKHEKEFYKALEDFRSGNRDAALNHFLQAADREPSAALLAVAIMGTRDPRAVGLLERVIMSDVQFPTELMAKYSVTSAKMTLDITRFSDAQVPLDALGAALILAEAYQDQGRLDDAVGLLEEVDEIADEPAVTLSLCELYAIRGHWQGVIQAAQKMTVVDDITFEINYIYGLALQQQGLHEAALDVFTNALKKQKDQDPVLVLEMSYARAISYEATNKKAQARKEFEKIYAANTQFRDVPQRLGLG